MYTEKDFEAVKNIILKGVPSVSGIILFGSYARGTAKEESDMDILIILEKKYGWRERQIVLNGIYRDTARKGYLIDFVLQAKEEFEIDKKLPTTSKLIAEEGRLLWMKA
ncbi:nucleotidyltransferase domain-containing protein [bacterium]|nr:MAG: nucleotidyltransferase domain-containing protein [bacterium]